MKSLSSAIAWGSERDDTDIKLYEEIDKMSLADIIKLYDEVTDGEMIKDRTKYNHIRAVIADKFEFPQRDIIVPFITDIVGDLSKRVDELEKAFKQHRHQIDKPYSEKPSW